METERDSELNRHRGPVLGLRSEDDLSNFDPASPQPFWVLSSPEDPAHERLSPSHGVRYRIALCEWFNARQNGRWMIVRDDAMEPIAPQGSFVVYRDDPEPLDDLLGKLVVAWRGSTSEAIGWLELLEEEDSASPIEERKSRIRSYQLRSERPSHDRQHKRSTSGGTVFKRITAVAGPDIDPRDESGTWTVRRILWVVESSLDGERGRVL